MEASKLLSALCRAIHVIPSIEEARGVGAEHRGPRLRLAMALSVRAGAVSPDWAPNPDEEEGESATGFRRSTSGLDALQGRPRFVDGTDPQAPGTPGFLAWACADSPLGGEWSYRLSKRGDWIRTVHACLPGDPPCPLKLFGSTLWE